MTHGAKRTQPNTGHKTGRLPARQEATTALRSGEAACLLAELTTERTLKEKRMPTQTFPRECQQANGFIPSNKPRTSSRETNFPAD